MNISQHHDGIGGDWIEFQLTNILGLEDIDHWKEDSLYLRPTNDVPYMIFDKFLHDGWWLKPSQLSHSKAVKLANELMDTKGIEELALWILSRSQQGSYLNILGV